MHYIDHFGEKSSDYLQFRPDYPQALYQYLAGLVSKHDLAWDCGTGNGQAASRLADYFKQVIGSDINQAQLDIAIKKENVNYFCWPSEKTDLQNASVDLITVAQALHWFDLDSFYQEVKRVAKYTGIVAAWCYSLGFIHPDVDIFIKRLYSDVLGANYWPKQREYIDNEYQTIPFPFKRIESPAYHIEKSMNFTQLIGYLNTWSAVKEYQQLNQENPINLIFADLQMAWGDPTAERVMTWPIHLLVGHVF
ncbi:putative methyltransferase [Aquicella siphonis]|uniref:Putative methyltransferase n=1 Tax=Aquicella siphonis TaxID=254247 RepID=A0A5E4PKR0_9COXI|nr:class I SAM-dependent methyltransferase [Aquicella siphonis]VVC76997.1 putative methyltransferase [Aquicella siphonis]